MKTYSATSDRFSYAATKISNRQYNTNKNISLKTTQTNAKPLPSIQVYTTPKAFGSATLAAWVADAGGGTPQVISRHWIGSRD